MQHPAVIGRAGSGFGRWLTRHALELCALAASVCLWALAYQLPLALTLHVGGETALARREDDAPFLRGANGSEPADRVDDPADPRGYVWWFEEVARSGQPPYRWMRAESAVVVPGAGGGPYLVEILARSGRPDGSAAASVWTPGAAPPVALSLPAGPPRRYRLLAPALPGGELRLTMRTAPYVAPGDPRELGFVLHQVRLRDVGPAPRAPAWPTLGWLALTLGVAYALARALQIGRPGALAFGAGLALAAAVALARFRPALTVFAPTLAMLALSCAALAALAWLLARALLGPTISPAAGAAAPAVAAPEPGARRPDDRRVPLVGSREAAHVLALVLLAFALRMAGMLHPQALFSDLGFHANNLFRVTIGQVFLTAGLPADAGGGQSPYPPGAYLLLLPGELIAAVGEPRRLLVQGGTALLDSLAVAMIWALLRRAGLGVRAAALGAACYLLPTPALESFSIGEYANLAGQALALPLLTLLGLGLLLPARPSVSRPHARTPYLSHLTPHASRPHALTPHASHHTPHASRFLLLLTAAVALGLLGHSGVTLSVGALLAAACALAWAGWLVSRGARGAPDSSPAARSSAEGAARGAPGGSGYATLLTAGAALGLAVAVLFFYSAPIYVDLLAGRAGGGAGGTPPLQVAADTALALLGLVPPQNTRVALPPLLGPLGVAGLALLAARRDAAAPLRALLAAWWAGTLLTLALLIMSGQGVRWAIFLYPALCIGAGACLDALWRRGALGRVVAAAALAVVLGAGLLAWVVQIRDFIHV